MCSLLYIQSVIHILPYYSESFLWSLSLLICFTFLLFLFFCLLCLFHSQLDKEVLDEFMKDAMELRRQSLQKASDGIEDGSKYSLQEASGSKTPGSDTVPTLQRGAATKASGPLEAASSSNNNTSGQRKVMKKLPPPPISTKSRPAPPPPPRAVSQCAQPATSRPPRPPPPSQKKLDVEGVKSSPKHNEQKASKDGSSRGSGHPQKCRSDLRTKKEYPKELNPFEFDVDISLPSNEKTSNCDLTPDLNPLSEEYNDEQGWRCQLWCQAGW